MIEKELFAKKANDGYAVCYAGQCPHYRTAEKVNFAKGMMHIFNDDMPRRVTETVR